MRFTRDGKKLIIGQMGDSRVYRLREEKIERVSPEDSLVEVAIKYGLLNSDQDVEAKVNINDIEEKIKEISGRNDLSEQEKQKMTKDLSSLLLYLTRISNKINAKQIPVGDFRNIIYGESLGQKNVNPHIVTYDVKKGDKYLVSCDGIHDNLTDKEIAKILSNDETPEEKAKKLVIESKNTSHSENPRAKEDDMTAIVVEIKDKKEAIKFERETHLKKTREALEADLKAFETTINTLGIKEIRSILKSLTQER